MEQTIDLCDELKKELINLNFEESVVSSILNSNKFIEAIGKPSNMQRAILTNLFYTILVNSPVMVPSKIRIALNASTDSIGWLDDYKLVILPFIRHNVGYFFPKYH